jgi:hypothetical protein
MRLNLGGEFVQHPLTLTVNVRLVGHHILHPDTAVLAHLAMRQRAALEMI